MKQEKIIVIGGGVGPMAGVKLHEHIIQHTKTDGTDQDHLRVIHLSFSSYIPDRTAYLQGKTEINPAKEMFRVIEPIGQALLSEELAIGIPCNTFHAPRIFDEFTSLIGTLPNTQVVHMIRETATMIEQVIPGVRKIGLMSTSGTRTIGVYQQILEPMNYEVIQVPQDLQEELHETIYDKQWGIKAVFPVTQKARKRFEQYVQLLKAQQAEAVILGCTEIPLALPEKELFGIRLIDPMVALARSLVREANSDKLK
ncbi:aspartate/glutamate racemase family protein [Candidatus Roizmanbacteria bacterium]|nr:aspartate/glutamate racemase family protein [Candidatus Roizmanbacteria bacterium]